MDDDNGKEENEGASTSKKESKDRKDDDEFDDRDHDVKSYSESTASYYSGRSPDMKKDTNADLQKMASVKGIRLPERRKRVRRGRVMKPRKSVVRKRYQPVRRGATRKRQRISMKHDREQSVSSIFTNHSSRSDGASRSCAYCGHRCCGRRYKRDYDPDKNLRRQDVKAITKHMKRLRKTECKKMKKNLNTTMRGRRKTAPKHKAKNKLKEKTFRPESIQTGSQSKMLSPLFVGTNASLADEIPNDRPYYLEITPEMIYETLQILTKWKQIVPLPPILEYIKINYPVNQDTEELTQELSCKLAIATIIGIISETVKDNVRHWSIANRLMRRGLVRSHVSLFWKVYCDTMSPVRKRVLQATPYIPPVDKGTGPESGRSYEKYI